MGIPQKFLEVQVYAIEEGTKTMMQKEYSSWNLCKDFKGFCSDQTGVFCKNTTTLNKQRSLCKIAFDQP